MIKTLAKIQRELNAPKNQRNNFGNYNYRSTEDILQAVKPLLGDNVILLDDDIRMIGDRIYVVATAILKGETGEIKATGFAREAIQKKGMDEAQVTGAASSYARKYALNALFAIDDSRDADTQENEPEVKEADKGVLKAIKNCVSEHELKSIWKGACKEQAVYVDALRERKLEFKES